jgi:hypothetical protein
MKEDNIVSTSSEIFGETLHDGGNAATLPVPWNNE